MGKGDKKSRRGKIIIGSFGVRRPQRKSRKVVEAKPAEVKPEPVKAPKKPAKPIEEQLEIPVLMPETPVVVETPESPVEVKKPVKKTTVKKTTAKAETEETKPKVSKTKKKPAESTENPEKSVEG